MGEDLNRIRIDPGLADLLTPLTDAERGHLEHSLIDEGCRDPIVLWAGQDVLLDGHARYEICTRLGIPFNTVEVELPDREEAIRWRLDQQLSRRNLNPTAAAYYRGRCYEMAGRRQGARTDLTSGHSDRMWTSRGVAEWYGVGERTVRRDAMFSRALDELARDFGPGFRAAVLTRKSNLTRREVIELARRNSDERQKALRQRETTGSLNPAACDGSDPGPMAAMSLMPGVAASFTAGGTDDPLPPDASISDAALAGLNDAWERADPEARRHFASRPDVAALVQELLRRAVPGPGSGRRESA